MTNNPDVTMCPLCDGMGVVGVDVPVGHAAFGKAFRCPCRDSWIQPADESKTQQAISNLFGDEGSIPANLRGFTFDHFKALPEEEYSKRKPALVYAYRLAKHGFIELKSGVKKQGLILSGVTGLGKSSIAAATSRVAAELGHSVLFKDFNDLISDIQDTYNPNYKGKTKTDLIELISRAKILVLDDVGGTKNTDHLSPDERKILYAIIRPRWANRRPTIITTNLKRDRFKQEVDARTYRRSRDLCVWVDLDGSDLTPYGQEL